MSGELTRTYFFVEVKEVNGEVKTVHHKQIKDTGEYLYKFMSENKANEFAIDEKKCSPEESFRVVKCVEKFTSKDWF